MDSGEIWTELFDRWVAGNCDPSSDSIDYLRKYPPEDADFQSLALVAHDMGKLDDALYFAIQGINRTSSYWNSESTVCGCNFIAGHCYELRDDLVNALKYYRQALAAAPNDKCIKLICDVMRNRVYDKRLKAVQNIFARLRTTIRRSR